MRYIPITYKFSRRSNSETIVMAENRATKL